jgi:hypothetical protein
MIRRLAHRFVAWLTAGIGEELGSLEQEFSDEERKA